MSFNYSANQVSPRVLILIQKTAEIGDRRRLVCYSLSASVDGGGGPLNRKPI